jgi:membrane protein
MAHRAWHDSHLPADAGSPEPTSGHLTRLRSRGEETATRYAKKYMDLSRRIPAAKVPLEMAALYISRQGMLLASAVAFRTFLWLLPLALLAAGLMAGISSALPGAADDTLHLAGVTGAVRQEITKALEQSRGSWVTAVLVGLVLSVWTTRTLMRNLVIVNAHVWDATVPRRTQREVLRATLVFGAAWLGIFLGAALVVRLDDLLPGGVLLSFLSQAAISGAGWVLITLHLPDRRRSWLNLLPGGLLFGVGLATLHVVSRVYLPAKIEHSSALYGSLGVAGAVLVWLLVAGHLIVGCAVLNRVWLRHQDPTFDPDFDASLDLLPERVRALEQLAPAALPTRVDPVEATPDEDAGHNRA